MRKLYLSLLFFSCVAQAQFLAINEIDEFTGDRIIKVTCTKGDHWTQGDRITDGWYNYVYLSTRYKKLKKTGEEFIYSDFNIQLTVQGSCLSQYTGKMMFLFDDGSTIEAKQISETDCNKNLNGEYLLSFADLGKLATSPVKKFRIYTTTGYIDYEVADKKKNMVTQHYALIQKTIKEQ